MRKNATEKINGVSNVKYGAVSNAGVVKCNASAPPPTVMELLSVPMIRALTASGLALGFICAAFDVLVCSLHFCKDKYLTFSVCPLLLLSN